MQLHRHHRLTERLQRIGQQDLATIDLEALLLHDVGDIAVGHRAVKLIVLADLASDRDLDGAEPRADRLGGATLLGFTGLDQLAFALDALLVGIGRQQGQLARQEVVSRIAVRHLDDFPAAADVLDMVSQNDFHGCSR
jgi:hypothetical protein